MSIKDWIVYNSNNLTKYGIFVMLGISLIYLIITSIIIKDLKYPTEHPILFTIETLLFSFVSSLVYFLMAYGRGSLSWMSVVEYLIISIKFGVMHILLQFSGFYSYAIPTK
jgi:hypothetical protein